MKAFDVISDISGLQFKELLREMFSNADSVGFVIQGQTSERAIEMLNRLEFAKLNDELVQEWPGTRLTEGHARLLEYAPSRDVLHAISDFSDSLFGWSNQMSPEDLFIKSGRTLILESTGHECQATLKTEQLSPIFQSLLKDGVILSISDAH